nr:hypothetical protein Itr_chr11CG16020 [Ipomoea trifida]
MDPTKFLDFEKISMDKGNVNGVIQPPGGELLANFYGRVVKHPNMRGVLVPLFVIATFTGQGNPENSLLVFKPKFPKKEPIFDCDPENLIILSDFDTKTSPSEDIVHNIGIVLVKIEPIEIPNVTPISTTETIET